MKNFNLIFLMCFIATAFFHFESNAQCTDERNILLFSNSDGSSASMNLVNASDDQTVTLTGSPVIYTQGTNGDVQISDGSTRYYTPDGQNGTTTYTNFFLTHNGTVYNSGGNASNNGYTESKFKAYKKADRIGSGTEADPYRIRVQFYADVDNDGSYNAASDILVTKTISYVNGEVYTRNDYVINNPTGMVAKVYEQRDEEYPGNNDKGFGYYATANTTELTQGTGIDFGGAGIFSNVIALVNGEQLNTTDTEATANTKIVGFTQGQDGSPWLSYTSTDYQRPYTDDASPIANGTTLSNKIVATQSDIGFTVQLPDAGNGETSLTLYEIVGKWQDICASPPPPVCAAPTLAITAGDTNSDNKICPSGETITLTASSTGVTNPQYEFSQGGTIVQPFSATNMINVSSAGSYTVKVKGDNCTDSEASTPIVITAATAAECNPPAQGSVDCDKIMVFTMPTAGMASNHTVRVPVNVTQTGEIEISISGSGLTIIGASPYKYDATATGEQFVDVPVRYDGTALGSATITVNGFTNSPCTIDLTDNTAVKDAVIKVWSKECLPSCGPSLK